MKLTRCRTGYGCLRLAVLVLGALASVVHSLPAQATPNLGPDPDFTNYSDYYGSSYPASIPRKAKYVLSRSEFAMILQIRLKIYLPSPAGTITVEDAHLCINRTITSASPYSYYTSDDRYYDFASSGQAARYRVTNTGGTVSTLNGNWSSASNCTSQSLVFNVSGSTLDPNTGMYPYTFEATALANGEYANLFNIVASAGAIISPDVTQSSQSFGMHTGTPIPPPPDPEVPSPPNPYRNFSNWELPFGPDCTVTTPTVRSYVEMYDDDNFGNYNVQANPFWMQMREYDRNGNYVGVLPPVSVRWTNASGVWGTMFTNPATNSSGGWVRNTYNSTVYDYIYTTGNEQAFRSYYDFKRDKIYRLFLFNVFYNNKLQFQLPFESVYYYRSCQQATATVQPSSTVDKATMTYPDTATFTHYLNVTNFSSSGSVNYSIQRYRNGVAVGGPQTGSTPFSGNGQLTIRANTFTSAPGDLGARVCERLTLTDPGGGLTISGSPSEACTTIVARPYLSVTNNDVWAGGRFDYADDFCTSQVPRLAGIRSWVQTGSGAASEYGVLALGGITDFGSGGQPGGNGLTFANSPANGNFGAPTRCMTNYYNTVGTTGAVSWPGIAGLPGGGGQRKYSVSGNLTLAGGTVPAGTQAVLLVNGDVTITGNVNYANNYAAQSDIPSLWIVATGNINIQENVTALAGLYVAQGTSSSPGRIQTCVQTGQTTTYSPLKTSNCGNSLEVYGALIADKILWQRTRGTAAAGQPEAEAVRFAPELYLNSPFSSAAVTGGLQVQDSKELPPVY